MKKDELPELVDNFGRTQNACFPFKELVSYVRREVGKVDEDALYDFAATSDYLFESWKDPMKEIFVPRRVFFQAAQFRITPVKDEVDGGYIVPGHRLFPFMTREVFPADAWLVLPDGSALHTRKESLPTSLVMACLHFFGSTQSVEYLVLDDKDNTDRLKPPYAGEVAVTVFDLRDFFAQCGFQAGDSLMLTVIDWLQGVFSVEHAPARKEIANMGSVRKWTEAMRDAFEESKDELGTDGDCYEQLAYMMHLAEESAECESLMKDPPLSIAAFFNLQKGLAVKLVGDRGLFWDAGEEPSDEALEDFTMLPESDSELDAFFQELGLSISEGEAEAYMRNALFHGKNSPDWVLAQITGGRALFFRSAEDQELFHDLWCDLWDDVREEYSLKKDACGSIRSDMIALNDKCLAALRQFEAKGGGKAGRKHPAFMELGNLNAMLGSSLVLLNLPEAVTGNQAEVFGGMMEKLAPLVDDLVARLAKA
ncbi:MAG: hypothetical protein K9M54_07100 [Kiritimatiellales bacterium]|nr:hypothetical protein [Kiritimatiellales bacterium]